MFVRDDSHFALRLSLIICEMLFEQREGAIPKMAHAYRF